MGADDRAAIQELLDERAGAFLDRDRSAFLATIDPTARAFRARQARLFDNSAAVPFGTYELVADWARYGDLVRAREVARYAADAIMLPLTHEHYTIRGFDPDPAVEDAFYTFVQRNGDWLIASDTDLDDIGLLTVRHPWDLGPLETARSEHFLGLAPPCDGFCPLDSLLPLAEEALDRLNRAWTVPWPRKVVLVVPHSDVSLKRMLQATFDPAKFVAFAYSTIDPDEGSYTGHRIIVNPPVIAGRGRDEVLTILTHELLHVATRALSGPFVPLFVEEGLAEVAGHGESPTALAYFDSIVGGGAFDRKLPEDFQFSAGTGNDIYLSYQEAQSAVRYFIDRWGIERFREFYERLGRTRLSAGLASWHVERALRRTLHLGLRAFERAWAASI